MKTGYETHIYTAAPRDRKRVRALAKLSPFTRDFANPPMSLKQMEAVAFEQGEVYICTAVEDGHEVRLLGFIWCRPMKPRHMPFSTVYYMGVDPEFTRKGVAKALLAHAIQNAKEGRVELVCEDRNEVAKRFYERCGGFVVSRGVVGKEERSYTRFGFQRGLPMKERSYAKH